MTRPGPRPPDHGARVSAGIRARAAEGLPVGARPKLTPDQVQRAAALRAGGECLKAIAYELGVSINTVRRAVARVAP